MVYIIALSTALSTYLGGQFALRFRDRLHLVVGFSAGAVIGLAFFHLLPEALSLGANSSLIMALVAAGFFAYLLADRLFLLHAHEEGCEDRGHRGALGAGSLVFHSFLDGLAIGFGFQVSTLSGIAIALAVLVHDFADGVNTVGLVLRHGGSKEKAGGWLLLDAFAPVLGVLTGTYFVLSASVLGLMLALFCGFFMYIGIVDLLHESHHAHPGFWTTAMTVLGALVLFGVSLLLP